MNIETRSETSIVEIPAVAINKPSKEVLRACEQAKTLILNNELYDKLGLRFAEDVRVFELSIEERLLRNEIIRVSDKISSLSNKGILGFVNREIIKHHKKRIENLYKAKEIIYLQKEDIVRTFSPKAKERAHYIDLAANSLFGKAQEIHKTPLMPETILDNWIVDDWALSWEEKIHGE